MSQPRRQSKHEPKAVSQPRTGSSFAPPPLRGWKACTSSTDGMALICPRRKAHRGTSSSDGGHGAVARECGVRLSVSGRRRRTSTDLWKNFLSRKPSSSKLSPLNARTSGLFGNSDCTRRQHIRTVSPRHRTGGGRLPV